jgi:putative flippase GtrA
MKTLVNRSILQFIRYAFVGCINTVVTFAVIIICKSILGMNPWLSNALGYILGIINSFIWNKHWVFCTSGNYMREAVAFFAGALVCYGIQLLSVWLLFNCTILNTWEYTLFSFTVSGYGVATICGNVIYTVTYYIYNKLITFRK